MATPPQIDVEALLAAIPYGEPSDRDSACAAARFEINQVLRSGVAGAEATGSSGADLDRAIERGRACLATDAKNLAIAALMVEALTLRFGFAGLRDGLTLMRRLIIDCWDECIPRPRPDGGLDLRAVPLESLASEKYLLLHLRRVNLIDATTGALPFSTIDVLKGRIGGRGPAPTEADVTTGPFGEAVAQSSRRFYECLADDVNEASQAEQELSREVKKQFADDAPNLRPIGRALQDCRQLIALILAVKPRPEPAPPGDGALADTRGAPATPQPEPAVGGRSGRPGAGLSSLELDRGRVLIAFHEQAQVLAEEISKLKANREEYDQLIEKLSKLDAEYEEIANRIARDKAYEPLFARRLGLSPE